MILYPHKLRGFVIDGASGQPLPGVVTVLACARESTLGTPTGIAFPSIVGILVSDATGYLSFDLRRFSASIKHLWIYPSKDETAKLDVFDTFKSELPFILKIKASTAERRPQIGLRSIQNPDAVDWELSPYSFCTKTELKVGEDDCQTPVPTTVIEHELGFLRVVRNTVPPGPNENNSTDLVDLVTSLPLGEPKLEFGEALEFRQQWFPVGHSLGQVLYTLPLAPCESVDLAVIDWARKDTAVRQDTVTLTETLFHDQRRDRTIEETVNSVLNESQGGWSLLGGTAASIPIDGAKVTASYGGGISQSWGNKTVAANSLQEVHDHVAQATSVFRSLNSTVIIQSTQQESSVIQTRTVTNHNHCHALTMQYFEVLRNFKVVTNFVGTRPVVLIPYQLIALNRWQNALRFRTILQNVLLDQQLADCFDAIVRLHYCPDIYPKGTPPSPTPTGTQPADPTHLGRWDVGNSLVNTEQFIHKGDEIRFISSGEVDFGGFPERFIYNADGRNEIAPAEKGYTAPGLKLYSLVFKIGASWIPGGTSLTYTSQDEGILIMAPNADARMVNDIGLWKVDVYNTPAQGTGDGGGTTPPGPNKAEDQCCESRLLSHLQSNLGFYNRAIWVLQDPVERRLLIEASLVKHPRIKYGIQNTPLAVSGNSVAFLYDDPDVAATLDNIRLQQISFLTLPTRGVFVEAQLGHCNSCETRDVTRFWKWEESPCERPPAIQGITPGPKGQPEPVPQPATLPAAVVQITQPPAAPDPVGLVAAMKVLGTPNIFRDMSGLTEVSKLLDGLVSGAVNLPQAQQMAKQAKDQLSKGVSDGGSMISGGASRPQSAPDLYDKLQLVQKARDQQGLLTTQAAQDAAQSYFTSDTTPAGQIIPASFTQGVQEGLSLFEHFVTWFTLNQDERDGKLPMHIEETPPHFSNIMHVPFASEAAVTLKFQVHSVKFTSTLDLRGLAALFDSFDSLSDPTVAECHKRSPTLTLTFNDEFRWLIPIPPKVLDTLKILFPIAGNLLPLVLKRRFDINVVQLDAVNASSTSFMFTVQTLADHPYGGRRAWRVKPTGQTFNGATEYELETTEFNSFSWLPDFIIEQQMLGEPPRLTWERFLTRFVKMANGSITDGSGLHGITIPGYVPGGTRADSVQQLVTEAEVQRVLAEYPALNDEFQRL
jgi:hypothetical protein